MITLSKVKDRERGGEPRKRQGRSASKREDPVGPSEGAGPSSHPKTRRPGTVGRGGRSPERINPSAKESTSQPSRPKERPRRPKTQKIRNTRDMDRHHLAIPKRNTERETFRLNKKEPDSNSGPREERKRNSVGEHVGKYGINVFFCL